MDTKLRIERPKIYHKTQKI